MGEGSEIRHLAHIGENSRQLPKIPEKRPELVFGKFRRIAVGFFGKTRKFAGGREGLGLLNFEF
jgi:hypothetical protein